MKNGRLVMTDGRATKSSVVLLSGTIGEAERHIV